MKKTRRILKVIIVLVIILSTVGSVIYYKNEKEKITYSEKIEAVLYFEQSDGDECRCMVVEDGAREIQERVYDNHYIYLWNIKYKLDQGGIFTNEIDYATCELYDLNTREKTGELDIKEILRPYFKNGMYVDWDLGLRQVGTGEPYIMMFVKKNQYGAFHDGILYINIRTGETVVVWEEPEDQATNEMAKSVIYSGYIEGQGQRREAFWKMIKILKDDEIGLLKKNGLKYFEDHFDENTFYIDASDTARCQISIRGDAMPMQNQQLYGMFPGLKAYQGNEEVWVDIYFQYYPSAEDILSLLMEDGQEISYEGCVLPAELSIDGQSHDIHSFEEYVQWRKQEE